jgi:hypothetical protein
MYTDVAVPAINTHFRKSLHEIEALVVHPFSQQTELGTLSARTAGKPPHVMIAETFSCGRWILPE